MSADEMDALAERLDDVCLPAYDYAEAQEDDKIVTRAQAALRQGAEAQHAEAQHAEAQHMVDRIKAEIARLRELEAKSGDGTFTNQMSAMRADDMEALLLGTARK